MLGKIRKFSSSVFAKIFLFIVAIPFVFWGMGPLFKSGSQNIIVKIDKEKIPIEEFVNYINIYTATNDNLDSIFIEKMLSNFIGQKIIENEIKSFNIILSDESLSKLIRNDKIFKKDNKFSRTEYEKFLVNNNFDAVFFEKNMSHQIKRELLLDFISGGIMPPNFFVNISFDKINQKRNVEVIRLNDAIKKKLNFSTSEIQTYFNAHKNKYNYVYKTIEFLEINPENLTGRDEFDDPFFEKIDKIDDLIVEGKKINFISEKFDLMSVKRLTFNKLGKNKNEVAINDFPIELINNIFSADENDQTMLITHENKYYIVEIYKTENIQKKINDPKVKEDILINLKKNVSRSFISKLAINVNKNKFKKSDFDKFSNDQNINIKKITIDSQNDSKILKEELVKQIYIFPEKQVIVVSDIGLTENYLIYIDKIEHGSITKDSDEYEKYFNLSREEMTNNIFNTYDHYLKNKYNIKINYKALEKVKNYIQ